MVNSVDISGNTVYTFDDNGNQSLSVSPFGERTSRTWGYENEVKLVELPNGQIVTSYYNADNRRTRKES